MSIHKEILKEYEALNNKHNNILEKKKQEVITKVPEISKLFDEIKLISIESIKNNLKTQDNDKNQSIKILNQRLKEINKKITELLILNGFNKNYLSKRYNCKKCKDTGFLNNKRCSCYKQKMIEKSYNSYNLNRLEEENFDRFDDKYYSKEVSDENCSPFDNINTIKKKCIAFCDNIENKKHKNLMFTGNTGLGKTFLSNAIADKLIKSGFTVIYETAQDLMDQVIKYKFSYNKDKEVEEIYNNILDCDLLIIDDLGTESLNNMKFTELFNILNNRLLKNKKILISTNLNLRQLYDLYEERVISRLIGNFTICRFFGDDIRLIKKKEILLKEKENN